MGAMDPPPPPFFELAVYLRYGQQLIGMIDRLSYTASRYKTIVTCMRSQTSSDVHLGQYQSLRLRLIVTVGLGSMQSLVFASRKCKFSNDEHAHYTYTDAEACVFLSTEF